MTDSKTFDHNQQLIISVDWFAPGIRAGGPIRSCTNLAMLLGESTEVLVITSSRDLGVKTHYQNVPTNQWVQWRDKAKVLYSTGAILRMIQFAKTVRANPEATVYLNSMFSFAGTLWPLLWVQLTRSKQRVVLAPRGMLKRSALNQKRWKKQPLVCMIRLLGLVRNVIFHATSNDEVQEIKAAFNDVEIRQIPNVPAVPISSPPDRKYEPGVANLCFVGRVHPIKNLLWLLEVMKQLSEICHVKVVGPIEDQAYKKQCDAAVKALPNNVSVVFEGPKSEDEIKNLLINADAMILPTLGENFGHAIFEAFATGTPVVLSDRTIWRDLVAKQAGWDVSLENPDGFIAAIEALAEMSEQQHQSLRNGALMFASDFVERNQFAIEYPSLFFGASLAPQPE